MNKQTRYPLIDYIRGFAVIQMAIFHFAYDLSKFGYVEIDFQQDPFWYPFPRFIVFCFLICVGIGLALGHKKGIQWSKVKKRFFKLASFALMITIATYFMFPKNWIFFGTLHNIACASILGLFFIPFPRFSAVIGTVMLITNLIWQPVWLHYKAIFNTIPLDYIPLFPWLGVVLIGIWLESIGFHKWITDPLPAFRWLEWLGIHSLWIYLLHQPILFGLVKVYYEVEKMLI